jgi:hypothetical protein
MRNNPYPAMIDDGFDRATENPRHGVWQEGYYSGKMDGVEECLEAIERNLRLVRDLLDAGVTREQIMERIEAAKAELSR